MKKIIIGTRESELALAQSELVLKYIKENCEELQAELLKMKTTGDLILDRPLNQVGGKGLFVKELDLALIENRTQLSVHSLKDLPMEVPEELPVLGYSKREDERDVLVLPQGVKTLDFTLPIGTSSLRRSIQLRNLYPGCQVKSIRGNIRTRLKKLDQDGTYGGIVLAAAGLKRLGLENRIYRYFSTEEMIPAAGQGILVLQGRSQEDYGFLQGFFNEEARDMAKAERGFVTELNGGCSSPVAAHAVITGQQLILKGLYYEENGTFWTDTISGDRSQAQNLGICLARKMKQDAQQRQK